MVKILMHNVPLDDPSTWIQKIQGSVNIDTKEGDGGVLIEEDVRVMRWLPLSSLDDRWLFQAALVWDFKRSGGEILGHQNQEFHNQILETEILPVLCASELTKYGLLTLLKLIIEEFWKIQELTKGWIFDRTGPVIL